MPESRSRPFIDPFLLGLVVLAFALRCYQLDVQSVWYDEVFALSVSRLPFVQMNRALIQDVVHPPLHYYALHGWFQAFGFGTLQARLLSAILGTLAVAMVYILARYLFDRSTAILSALLLALSQVTIVYSQEARPYAQFLALCLCCGYLFLRGLREQRLLFWAGFLFFGALLCYTHYYGFFVLAAFLLFGLAFRNRYPIRRVWLWGGVLWLAAAYTPWLSSGVIGEIGQKFHRANPPSPTANPQSVHWYTPVTVLNSFNNGRTNGVLDPAPWWTFLVGGVLFSLPAAAALMWPAGARGFRPDTGTDRESLLYLALLAAVPVALALAMGSLGFYSIRYVAFCAAPYYILVARGIVLVRRAAVRWTLVIAILAYSAYALRANYFIPYKEDYKGAFASLAPDYQPGDCAAVAQPWEERQARWAWSIYEGNRAGLDIRPIDSLVSTAGQCERVWLISITHQDSPTAHSAARTARQQLGQAYNLSEERRFFWIVLDLYTTSGVKLGNRQVQP